VSKVPVAHDAAHAHRGALFVFIFFIFFIYFFDAGGLRQWPPALAFPGR